MFRILIAEDEEIIRRGVSHSLDWSEIGCEIAGAVENGAEALTFLKSNPPDLLLCDIRMPELSGLDVARYIYENKIDCKVILLTGYNEFAYAQQAITYGVFDYLLKPVSPEALQNAVTRAVRVIKETRQQALANPRTRRTKANHDDAALFLAKLTCSGADPIAASAYDADALGLAAPRYSVAVASFAHSAKSGREDAGPPNARETLLAKLFDQVAAQAQFHILLPAQSHLLPLCIGYSNESLSDCYCWEMLQILYYQQTHSSLVLAIGEPVADLRQLHTAYEKTRERLSHLPPKEPESTNPIVKSVLGYLWEHYAQPVKLADVAEHVFLNPSYISRVMRKETGIGFVEQLLNIRVQKAKQLLLTTTCRTFEIAELTGFGSVKYFSQVFRQYTQMSPSQYRALKGNPLTFTE